MRFRSFHLKAFGHFTDQKIDFGTQPGCVDIVVGANEAGKSTTLRAINSMCFGIPSKTSDGYFHGYDNLLIGADFELQRGERRVLYRRKKIKNAIVNSFLEPVPDNLLEECLCGVSQAGFEALFCLDFDRLTQGSEGLLAEGGEVGRLLFEARSNLNLAPVLKTLSTRAEELYKGTPRARSVIDDNLKIYESARKELNRGDLATFKQDSKRLEELVRQADELDSRKRELDIRLKQLNRLRLGKPKAELRLKLLAELEQLAHIPQLDSSFRQSVRDRLNEKVRISSQIESLGPQIETHRSNLEHVLVDTNLLTWAAAVDNLFADSGGIDKMISDGPKRQAEVMEARVKAEYCGKELWPNGNVPSPGQFDTARQRQIRDIAQRLRSLRDQISHCEKQIAQLKNDLKKNSQTDGAETRNQDLELAVEHARSNPNVDTDLDNLIKDLEEQERTALAQKNRLGLANLDIPDAIALPVPGPATIRGFESQFASLHLTLQGSEKEIHGIKEEISRVLLSRENLLAIGDVPTLRDLHEVRQSRDFKWREIVLTGRPVSSDDDLRLSDAIRVSDDTADRLRIDADRSVQLTNFESLLSQLEQKLAEKTDNLKRLNTEWESLQLRWKQAWESIPTEVQTPSEMIEWRAGFDEQCRSYEKILPNQIHRSQLDVFRAEAVARLKAAMNLSTEESRVTPLLTLAQMQLTSIRNAETQRKERLAQARLAQSQISQTEAELKLAQADLDGKLREWDQATFGLNLGDQPAIEDVHRALDALQEISSARQAEVSAQVRIDGMNRQIEAFTDEYKRVAQSVGFECSLPSPQAVQELKRRLTEHQSADQRRKNLQENLDSLQKSQSDFEAKLLECDSDLRQRCELAKCPSVEDLTHYIQMAEIREQIGAKLDTIESEIVELAGTTSIVAFCVEAIEISFGDLDSRISEAESQLERLQDEIRPMSEQIGVARNVVAQYDQTERLLEEQSKAEFALTKVKQSVRPYLVYSLAESLVAAQVEAFRRANQGPILKRAGEIFSKLTDGSFRELASDVDDKDKPILIAVRANGNRVSVDGLSSATRMGLYLALRLACVHHHADTRECLPFIADDILLDFDDKRARQAFSVLGELAERTQVIMLTHHQHLANLAREELGARAHVTQLVKSAV